MPKYSIIVPVHNSATFMQKCLESVTSQTYRDFELIVVCDACTDDSWRVAMEYADQVLTTNFGNDGPPRQAGVDAARGDWILFLDDDDWWMHEYTLDIIDTALGNELGFDILLFGFIFRTRGYASPIRQNGSIWPAVWNKCYRRYFIKDTPFRSIQPTPDGDAPDIDWTRRILMLNPVYRILDMPLYYYNYGRAGSQTVEKVWRKNNDS